MKDGFTKDLKASHGPASFEDFHGKFSIKLVVIAGASAGTEYAMESARVTLGRGPGVDIEFADDAMSRQHAVIEYAAGTSGVPTGSPSTGWRSRPRNSTTGIS
jgi:hypothetical protein